MDTSSVRATDLYRALWDHARGARGAIFAAAGLLLGSQLVKLAVPWLAAQAIDALQVGGVAALGTAGRWIAAIFAATVLSWALHGPGRIIERNVALRVRARFTDRLVGRLFSAPLEWHEARHSGDTLHRVERSGGALYDFAQSQFVYLQNAVSLVGPLLALCWLSAPTGAAAIAGYGLVLWGVVRFDRSMMRLAADENAAHRRLQSAQIDALGNIVSVFALRLGTVTRERLRSRLDATFAPLRRMILLNEAKWCTVDVLGSAVWCLLLVLYVWTAHRESQALGTPLMLGGLFMVHQYAQQAGGVVTSIASHYQGFARHRADFASADPIFAAPSGPPASTDAADEATGADRPHCTPRARASGTPWHTLEIAGLGFVHASRHQPGRATLEGIGISLQRGRRIALVGSSGSGKSSLLRVLAGLYRAHADSVELDGAPVDLDTVASLATLIPQDAEVFEGTLRENLAMAGPADDARMLEMLRTVCLDDWLGTLASGLDTPLTERGGNLSGGQRQRIALARGLLAASGSTLLLLDEATSSLDPDTEARLLDRLTRAFAHACIVASVHRPALLSRFDEVLRLDAGRIVERTSHRPPIG